MQWLRQASGTTAASGPTISIGPCLDSSGAEYTGLAIGDLTLTKNGTSAAMAANATLTHVANGFYSLVMIGNNADTLGRLRIHCNKSGYQIPPHEFMVVPAMVYDSIVLGTDYLEVNGPSSKELASVTEIWAAGSRTLTSGDNIVLAKGTGITGLNDPTVAQIEAALLNESDGQALLAAISAQVQALFDGGADVPVSTLVSLIAAQITSDHGSGSYARNTEPVDVSADVTAIKALAEADIVVDKNTTPWSLVWYQSGTSTELLRKSLKDVDAADLTSTATIVGQAIEPEE